MHTHKQSSYKANDDKRQRQRNNNGKQTNFLKCDISSLSLKQVFIRIPAACETLLASKWFSVLLLLNKYWARCVYERRAEYTTRWRMCEKVWKTFSGFFSGVCFLVQQEQIDQHLVDAFNFVIRHDVCNGSFCTSRTYPSCVCICVCRDRKRVNDGKQSVFAFFLRFPLLVGLPGESINLPL